MIEGLTIRRRDDVVDRVEKRSTTVELLAKSGPAEVAHQHIEAGRHFFLYASDEWSGFELIFILDGVLTIEPGEGAPASEVVQLQRCDYIYHNGLPRRVYCRATSDVELLLFSSSLTPSFDMARNGMQEMTALAQSVEEKDHATDGHCYRLERLAIRTSEKLGILGQSLIDVSYAAYLHDIGKVQVPSEILGKEGLLTDEEWEQMKRHPDLGAEMLREKDFLGGAAEIVRAHHERFDGSGYPRGLKGEEIPIGARIIAVVDTYDAITSVRPYQAAQAKDEAIEELRKGGGTQFDPQVLEAFFSILREDEILREEGAAAKGAPDAG